jgi:hypothetical protein
MPFLSHHVRACALFDGHNQGETRASVILLLAACEKRAAGIKD